MQLNDQDKQHANWLWQVFKIDVSFNPVIRRYPEVDFLGFAGVIIQARPTDIEAGSLINAARTAMSGFKLFLNDLRVKNFANETGQFLEMKREPGRNTQTYYDAYAPGSRALRAVLHAAVFSNPDVKAALEVAASMPRPAAQKSEESEEEIHF